MRTHKTKSLWFAYHQCAPPGTTAEALAEALIQCGLIEAVERDQWTGAVVRYAELPDLYRAGDGEAKERMVRSALKDLMQKMRGDGNRADAGPYERNDPKHPEYVQRLYDLADDLRKRGKGE